MAYPVAPAAPLTTTDPTAVFGRRVVAVLIDGAIAWVPATIWAANNLSTVSRSDYEAEWAPHNGGISFESYCNTYTDRGENGICLQSGDTLILGTDSAGPTLVIVGVWLLTAVLLQGITGWTIGKLAMGLRTVQADGRACGIPKAGLRWLLWIVDGMPCGIPLVGFITGLTTQGHRRVGDMAAKTFVVRKEAMGSPIVVPGLTAPPPPGAYAPPPGAAPWAPPTTAPDPTATGWAAPPAAGAWSPPPPPQWDQPTPPSPNPTPPGVEAPHWDDARNAYIQWDPDLQSWMQWDEPGQRWFKIAGQ
jgi:uncharacterized RDD family membrane protein YckC